VARRYRVCTSSLYAVTQLTLLVKFRRQFRRRFFPALRQQGVLRFALLGRPSAQRALPRVRCGVLRDALFGSPSVLHGVSCVPVGGRSAGIAAPTDDSLVLYGA
jgi:hypothetical protein